MTVDWSKEREVAEGAAIAAAKHLRQAMTLPPEILCDAGRDVKLQADRDAEAIILDRLSETGYAVLAEERGMQGTWDPNEPIWVVDPLDGTFNFSRRIPACCVSIALMRGDTALLGVTYDFNGNEMFEAVAGQGAYLNGQRIAVAAPRPKSQAVLATGFSAHRNDDTVSVSEYIRYFIPYKKVRIIGSAALAMAYVACGRFDAYVDDGAMLWDVAAGISLVAEAGGHVECVPSDRKPWGRVTRVAANQGLLDRRLTSSS